MVVIGIDPDKEKSGLALYDAGELVLLDCLDFAKLIGFFDLYKYKESTRIIVSAGWLNNKSIFHGQSIKVPGIIAQIGVRVGINHGYGMAICDYAKSMFKHVHLVKPSTSKLTHSEFKQLTGWSKRTNQEQRDAAIVAWPFRTLNLTHEK